MSQNDKIESHILKKFEVVKKSGSGAYGIVWKVIDRKTHKVYGLKKNFDAFQNSTDAQRTYRQIMFLLKFKHPNIVQIKQVIKAANQKDIYILFEYMDIDLYTLIRQNMLGDQHKRYIIYQVAKAMHYLHTAQLIHRDIKPSNILVNEDCLAKICDFGLIRSVQSEQFQDLPPILTDYIATRWYRAPQILLGSKKYAKAADVWSFGCLLGQMIKGKPLFPGHSTLNQIERVLTWTGPPTISDLNSLKTDFGKEMLDLLSKIKPISKKDWFSNISSDGLDLINKTLAFNPDKRLTMLQVLKHPYLKQFYNKKQIIEAPGKIRINISDNKKLSLNQYRTLIYKESIQQYGRQSTGFSENSTQKNEISNSQIPAKTIYKSRLQKALVRSASKNREDSAQKSSQKESNTVNIKKKYESLVGKNRQQLLRTKYMKTQQKEDSRSNFPKRKKSDNIVKYYTDKKKKSVSLYDAKKDSETLAKYMYENRKF